MSKLSGTIKSNCIAFNSSVFERFKEEARLSYWFMFPPLILNSTEGTELTWIVKSCAIKFEESLTVLIKLKANSPSASNEVNCKFKKLKLPSAKLELEPEYTTTLSVLSLTKLTTILWFGKTTLSTL